MNSVQEEQKTSVQSNSIMRSFMNFVQYIFIIIVIGLIQHTTWTMYQHQKFSSTPNVQHYTCQALFINITRMIKRNLKQILKKYSGSHIGGTSLQNIRKHFKKSKLQMPAGDVLLEWRKCQWLQKIDLYTRKKMNQKKCRKHQQNIHSNINLKSVKIPQQSRWQDIFQIFKETLNYHLTLSNPLLHQLVPQTTKYKLAIGTQVDYLNQIQIKGPQIMSIMEDLHDKYGVQYFNNLRIINFMEQCIIEDQLDIFQNSSQEWNNSLLIVVHSRLGLKKIPQKYIEQIQIIMQLPQFIGAIGGKSNKAYYILGFQDKNVLYIDPHYVRESYADQNDELSNLKQFYAETPKYCDFSKLQASIGFCFYFANRAEYLQFSKSIKQYFGNNLDSVFSIYQNKNYLNINDLQNQEVKFVGDFQLI